MLFSRHNPFAVVIVMLIPLEADGKGSDDYLGTWRGESVCAARNTACQDETVVYRLAKIPAKPGYFTVDADKIVDGKAVNMGPGIPL